MAIKEHVFSTKYIEAIKAPIKRDARLIRVCSKLRAMLEDYAISKGHSFSKLLVIDICNLRGQIRRDLLRHVQEVYPLSDDSKPSYISNLRRIITGILNQHNLGSSKTSTVLVDKEIPEYMEPMLPLLTRKKSAVAGRRLTKEQRLKIPYSEDGEYLLLAALNIHNRYNSQSLHTLLVDLYQVLLKELKKLSRRRFRINKQYFNRIRKELGFPNLGKRTIRIPLDNMLEPLRTEIRTYQSLVLSFGENKSLENQRQEEFFAQKAENYGITLYKNRDSSVKETIRVLQLFYGKIFHLIQARGMTSISIKDIMLIQTGSQIITGEEVPFLFNEFIDDLRHYERQKISRFKRQGFDSQYYRLLIDRIKTVAIFNGYFSLIKEFNKAYSKIYLDTWMIEHRKAVKKRIYSIEYLDEQIELLRPQFERIIKERTYIIRPRRSVGARADYNLCLFYVVVVLIRYLSYRQQCIRHCIFDVNIIFSKDGSITLSWSEDEVKNKKPIKITLTPERYDGLWEPIMHALTLYKKTIFAYAIKRFHKDDRLADLEGQFFLHLNPEGEFARFKENGASRFTTWFSECAAQYFVLPDEALELDINVNPQHLRGICMDWLYSLEVTEDELSLITGDEIRTIRTKYLSKSAVRDGTRAIVRTDRRIKEERVANSGYQSLIQEKEAKHRKELAQKEQENADLRLRIENIEKVLNETKASLASELTARGSERAMQRQQVELSKEVLAELRERKNRRAKTKPGKESSPAVKFYTLDELERSRVRPLHTIWFDTSELNLDVKYDIDGTSIYSDGEVSLISDFVKKLKKSSVDENETILLISPHSRQTSRLAQEFQSEKAVRVYEPNGLHIQRADIVIISFVTWNLSADEDCISNLRNLYNGVDKALRTLYLFGNFEQARMSVQKLKREQLNAPLAYFTKFLQPGAYFEQSLMPASNLINNSYDLIG